MNKILASLPKPNKTTAQIVLALLVVTLPLYWFVVRGAQRSLADAEKERSAQQTEQQRLERNLADYAGSPYSGAALQNAVGKIDVALPSLTNAPSPLSVAEDINNSSSGFGVTVTDLSATDEYLPQPGNLYTADITFTATGTLASMRNLVDSVQQRNQYTEVMVLNFGTNSNGSEVTGGGYTAKVQVRMFATDTPPIGQAPANQD